jgi:integrase
VSRPLTGSVRQHQGRWCASLPAETGTVRRREERFATENEARAWLGQALAAVREGRRVPDPVRRLTPSRRKEAAEPEVQKISPDIASVASAWMAAAYEDLRRGGPERAESVRRIVEAYLVPWFAPRTETIADVTYYMVHEWLLHLVGRAGSNGSNGSTAPGGTGAARTEPDQRREVSLQEAARLCGVSVPTMRRRWRAGQLRGAYRDGEGRIRIPVRALTGLGASKGAERNGLSKRYVSDALWILRKVLSFARANGLFPAGFDPTEGLDAPLPDKAAARRRPPTTQPRPLSLAECARIAGHLHAVHQSAFWLQRIMGLRISEAFGLLVGDLVDLGETGLLAVQGQGGKTFSVRDDHGAIVAVPRKQTAKTAAGSRVLVVPAKMMDLLRVAIEAFHTDPETGIVNQSARLVPGIQQPDRGGQLGYEESLQAAAGAEGLGSDDLGFLVSSHLLRKSAATDLAWATGIEEPVRRRFMGHRAGEDVFGRIYTLDHPDVAPLAKVAEILDTNITAQIGTLLAPTTRRVRWARSNPIFARREHVTATLLAACWLVEPGGPEDPLCDAPRVAEELGIAETTARRWMTDGTLPSVAAPDDHGVPRRFSRLSDVWAYRDQLASVIRLPDLAEELGIRYDELYRSMRHLGLRPAQHATSNEFTLTPEEADALRAEHARVRALHRRSAKLTEVARQLKFSFTTVRAMVTNGDLEPDPETDTSGARFVTRASVAKCWIARGQGRRRRKSESATVPFAEVVRFTGLGRRAVVDLIRSGVLQEVPGMRGSCQITVVSLESWLAEHRACEAGAGQPGESCG